MVVTAGDFTVRGGSASGIHGGLGQELRPNERALEWRIPLIRLLDAAGGSVRGFEELGRTYLPDGNIWSTGRRPPAERGAGGLRRDGLGGRAARR